MIRLSHHLENPTDITQAAIRHKNDTQALMPMMLILTADDFIILEEKRWNDFHLEIELQGHLTGHDVNMWQLSQLNVGWTETC